MTSGKDMLTGATLFALGAVMAAVARGFPNVGGMAYGPGLFPTIIAGGLMLSGVGIVVESRRGAAPQADAPETRMFPVLATVAILVFFALALVPLGFHITAAIAFLAAVRVFGGGWITAALMALTGPVLLHVVFYTFMRVPLPWGLLLPVAW